MTGWGPSTPSTGTGSLQVSWSQLVTSNLGTTTRYPLELHLVHIASSLGRGASAVTPREVADGLVVVAVHFQVLHTASKLTQAPGLLPDQPLPGPSPGPGGVPETGGQDCSVT